MKLFVGNLSFSATEDSVRSLFETHGAVDRVSIMTDRDTGRSRGFGFVEMSNDNEAQKAISALGGSMFPRFLMPESMQRASLVLFNSWALDGFTNVFWRELPLTSLITPVAVLIAWAVAFFFVARQLTRRWEMV